MSTTIDPPVSGQDGDNHYRVSVLEPPVSECLTAILQSLKTMKEGDFSVRLPVSWTGLPERLPITSTKSSSPTSRWPSNSKESAWPWGKEGKTRERIRVEHRRGAWDDMEVSVNTLVEDLLRPTTEVTRAIAAVAEGTDPDRSARCRRSAS